MIFENWEMKKYILIVNQNNKTNSWTKIEGLKHDDLDKKWLKHIHVHDESWNLSKKKGKKKMSKNKPLDQTKSKTNLRYTRQLTSNIGSTTYHINKMFLIYCLSFVLFSESHGNIPDSNFWDIWELILILEQ